MNEMQAALGLVQLKHYDNNIAKREFIVNIYRKKLNIGK
jgi:dTDP-4-amino-4,6-dideoxygalactose transaminase